MSFVRPYSYESEPPEAPRSHHLAFIAVGLIGTLHFQWDHGNSTKNHEKHGVTQAEIETAVTDQYGFIALVKQKPRADSVGERDWQFPYEERFLLFSRRPNGRAMIVVFTLRMIGAELAIRPISARYIKEEEMRRRLGANGYYNHFW